MDSMDSVADGARERQDGLAVALQGTDIQSLVAPARQPRPPYKFENSPAELRAIPQWVLSSIRKQPVYVNARGGTELASVKDRNTWMTFDAATYYAAIFGMCVGFVITKDDSYCCIDQDSKPENPIHPDALAWYVDTINQLGSYTEWSPSGRGRHTWIKATDVVKKRDWFEIYSRDRFITVTGWTVIDGPVREAQDFADWFVMKLGGLDAKESDLPLVEVDPEFSDEAILLMAGSAVNSTKFIDLFDGRWRDYKQSQSEADDALIAMLAFYSKSNEQCRRLFRRSALGQRRKALRKDYCDRSLNRARKRQAEAEARQRAIQLDVSELIRRADALALITRPDVAGENPL